MILKVLVWYRVIQIPIGPFPYDTEWFSTIQGRTDSHWSVTVRYWMVKYDTGSYTFPLVRFSTILNGLVRYRVIQIPIGPFPYDTEWFITIQGHTLSHWFVSVRYWMVKYDTGSYGFPLVRFSTTLNGLLRYRVVHFPIGSFQYDTEWLSTIQGRTHFHWSVSVRHWMV